MIERITGCLLGGALGDALGAPFEGRQPPFEIALDAPLCVTDDTQLTLATCEAIIESNGAVDPEKIATHFAWWHKARRLTGLGGSTLKALSELSRGGHWALVGRKGERAAGNGAAMRIAPLAFCLDPRDRSQRVAYRDVCRITHHNDEAYSGALALALAVAFANEGQRPRLTTVAEELPDTKVRDRLLQLAQLDAETCIAEVASQFGCSGYVVESVPLALFAVERLEQLGFTDLLVSIINCGGDADTIASMAGQVSGTLLGVRSLPVELLDRLVEREAVTQIAAQFAHVSRD